MLSFYCYWLELMAPSKPKRVHKPLSIDQKIHLLDQINKKSHTQFFVRSLESDDESKINNYNGPVLQAWQANMDLQYVLCM